MEEWLNRIMKLFENHSIISGSLFAFFTSFLRLYYVRKSFTSKIIDSLTCAFVSSGVSYALITYFTIDENIAFFIGVFVGYLGTEEIKDKILKYIERKMN